LVAGDRCYTAEVPDTAAALADECWKYARELPAREPEEEKRDDAGKEDR
jgi:hypothetical protein